MKITNIRTKNNEIPSTDSILALEKMLVSKFNKAGFITVVNPLTRASLKIGLHMCSFRVDIDKLGHNADFGNAGRMCKLGYKKTAVPTWEQREQFNHIVNDCFDKLKLSATIKSGDLLIRHKLDGRINWWHPSDSYYGVRALEIKPIA